MNNKVIVTADSTCDLSAELKEKYHIQTLPLHINFDEDGYYDNIDITPERVFDIFYETKKLPKTAAISVGEYKDFFKPFINLGYEIVHINIGSALSACHQNCKILSQEMPQLHPVDSCNLSTGTGHIVLEAAMRAEKGLDADTIAREVSELVSKVHASFILDKLNFMAAGGRCSSVVALGANILGLKPCIEVYPEKQGNMNVSKKYRGKLDKVLYSYIDDQLALYDNIRTDKIFITHSPMEQELVNDVYKYLKSKKMFENIYITQASCTISSHCGPSTLGILFMTE